MISGEWIVCFAPDPWSDIWRNRHRLLPVFSRQNRVLYVEPRLAVRGLARRLRSGEIKLRHFIGPRLQQVRDNIFVYRDPIHFPRTAWRVVGPAIERRRDALLARAFRRLGVSRPILWLVRPDCWDLPGKFDEKAIIYQVVDDYLSYPGVTERARVRLDGQERAIGSRANLVIATSEHLVKLKRHLSSNILHVRNGVDAHTLEEGKKTGGRTPVCLTDAKRPVYGYIGGITEKLDFDLLETVAARVETDGGCLVLVGPINVPPGEPSNRVERLRASPGVIFTGKKPAEEIPDYVRAFDVGLIPYKMGDQARSIDPLKLYEYLAFGKPVVAVDIPSMQSFGKVVRIAKDPDDFSRLMREAALDKDDMRAAERRALASEQSWEKRAAQISDAIEAILPRE
jgi:glycosyltransferase involved in cell wall biosynthesis